MRVRGHRTLRFAAALASLATSAGASELADLIERGDRRAALALIESGADVNEAQGDGTTPLQWAAYRVDPELAALLLDEGAEPDARNSYGASPLGEAAKTGSLEIVELLLEAGADPEAPNGDGQTALMLASRSGSTAIAHLLIERGADVNALESWRGQSALMWAADGGFPEIVDLLIDHGAAVDFRAAAMDWPAQVTSEPRAQYRPVGGLTPLLYAARAGCTPCVRAILAGGADVDRPNPEGMTPLMIALDNGAFDTAVALLEAGANPHLWDWYGRTALYIAVDMNNGPRGSRPVGSSEAPSPVTGYDVATLLLAAGVDAEPQLNMHRPSRGGNIGRFSDDLLTTGATPLLRAAISQDLPTIRLLLEHGADVDLPNVMGVTPLIAAAGMGTSARDTGLGFGSGENRTIETLQALLSAGADVDARIVSTYNRTATIARTSSMTEREGQTALYGAIRRGWVDVVNFLIESGATVDIVDARGRTPIDVAMGNIGGRDNVVSEEIATRLRQRIINEEQVGE